MNTDFLSTYNVIRESSELIAEFSPDEGAELLKGLGEDFYRPGWDPEAVALHLTIWQTWPYYPGCPAEMSNKITTDLERMTVLSYGDADRLKGLQRLRSLQQKLIEHDAEDLFEANFLRKIITVEELSAEYLEKARIEPDKGLALAYESASLRYFTEFRKLSKDFAAQRDQIERRKKNKRSRELVYEQNKKERHQKLFDQKDEILEMLAKQEKSYLKNLEVTKGTPAEKVAIKGYREFQESQEYTLKIIAPEMLSKRSSNGG